MRSSMVATAQSVPPQQVAAVARSERRIGRELRALHESCDDVLHFRNVTKTVKEGRDVLAALHPEYSGTDVRAVARHWAVLLAPPAIWIIDVFLLSSVSEHLATLMFPDRPQLVMVARLLVALAVVCVEMGLATALHAAHEHGEETEGSLTYTICWAVSLGWAAILTTLLIATQQAAGAEKESSTRTLMYGLAGFCFLLHLVLPLMHHLLYEAKGYLIYVTRDGRLKGVDRRSQRDEAVARRQATRSFQGYARDINRHNAQFPWAPLAAGPFSVATRTVVNEIFSEGTIPPPNNQPDLAAPPPAGSAPTPPANGRPAQPLNDSSADTVGENEYLRTILARRQCDGEAEVLP